MDTMSIDPYVGEVNIFDEFLKYGLFLGAIFQIVCIGAVVFIPGKDDRKDGDSSDEDGSDHGSPHISAPQRNHVPYHRRKQDKKKRR
ncbi:UNVERIFIED_CONTAM: hypothetical protein RMT77_005727 [Armadillidium vulgare]|nr:Protein anon-73B1 [Armadillidium vulgare]